MRQVLIIFFILLGLFVIYSDDAKLIKRTVLIQPFVNKNNIKAYNYLSDSLMNALKANLMVIEKFNISENKRAYDIINKLDESKDFTIKNKTLFMIAKKYNIDVIITGSFLALEESILIQIEAYDILFGQNVAITNIKGNLGVDIIRLIDDSTKDMTLKMEEALPLIDQEEYKEMLTNLYTSLPKMSNTKKAGIILISIGSVVFATGLPILLYDTIGYTLVLQEYIDYHYETGEGYDEYMNSYYIFMGLLVSGITLTSIGVIMIGISIPFLVYKNKKKNISFNIDVKNNIMFSISFLLF